MKTQNVCGFFLLAGTIAAAAQAVPSQPSAPYLAGTATFLLQSKQTHRTYQISVALPRGYDVKHAGYPVLFAMDANAEFGMAVEMARLLAADHRMPSAIVVGIGYDLPGIAFEASFGERSFDLTPTSSAKDLADLKSFAQRVHVPEPTVTGGAPQFLNFIKNDLTPALQARYSVGTDRALFGHSLGGLFGVYALLHDDGFFQRFVIGSPSLWFDNKTEFKDEERYHGGHKALPARVYMGIGGLEESSDDPMVSDFERFSAVLQSRGYEGLSVETEILNGEDHYSVMPLTLLHGLESVDMGWAAAK
jgi:predicted alpha/beta superfamily hydrolase